MNQNKFASSLKLKKIVKKLLKAISFEEKYARHSFTFEKWSELSTKQTPIRSDEFFMIGTNWCIEMYPNGTYDGSEYVSVYLVNLSNKQLVLQYFLNIPSDCPKHLDYKWTDPEGVIVFQPIGNPDSSWGNEDYILKTNLEEFIKDDTLTIEVELNVYISTETINANSITLDEACADLSNFTSKITPKGRPLNEERKRQDKIIKSRFTSQVHV